MPGDKHEPKRAGRPRKYGEGARANLTMAWPVDLIRRVDAAAAEEGVSRQEFVIRWLEQHPRIHELLAVDYAEELTDSTIAQEKKKHA